MISDFDRVSLRVSRYLEERIGPAIYPLRVPAVVEAWAAPDEPVSFAVASRAAFTLVGQGQKWGKPWGTTWFRIRAVMPEEWSGHRPELVLDLGFGQGRDGFQAEGLALTVDGVIIKGVEPNSRHIPVPAISGEEITVFVEGASNPDFRNEGWTFAPTTMGSKATAGAEELYRLGTCFLGVRSQPVWQLAQELPLLLSIAGLVPEASTRRDEILQAISRCLDTLNVRDIASSAQNARSLLTGVLERPAHASAHQVVATGHAHIDSAWLWPVRETVRKCARTFSNVLSLMDDDPSFVFACSSAQQFAWMKETYPELFNRLAARVREGRFVPVGGMWVESDTNLPGGESLVRQFLLGKRFFSDEFDVEPQEVWLPDSFGFSAALPQIADHMGCKYFLTQKLSWNDTNAMPYSSFMWEGIDGTRLFTHFPPVSTYNSDLSPEDLHRSETRFQEKGRARSALVPFGYGDGGGGPTREMLARAELTRSLEGVPTVRIGAPSTFFAQAASEQAIPPVWTGELYLEKHRGTYTTQAHLKRGNRRAESLLHEAELWASTAMIRCQSPYPHDEIERAWEVVLLNQFHDILPGSSIAWVNEDAQRQYDDVADRLETLIDRSLTELAGKGDRDLVATGSPLIVEAQALPLGISVDVVQSSSVSVRLSDEGATLLSRDLSLTLDRAGRFLSLVDIADGRELVPAGHVANELQLFEDLPVQWDAWDIDLDYRRAQVDAFGRSDMALLDDGLGVRVRYDMGRSTVTQEIMLAPNRPTVEIVTTVDWREHQRLLKLAFPLAIHATSADFETQFGFVTRSSLTNTSWDVARFESCAHRWVRIGEPDYHIALTNQTSYGHDFLRVPAEEGGSSTIVRQSLLRSALYPDPGADHGRHVFYTALRAGAEGMTAAAEGYHANLPVRRFRGSAAVAPLAHTTNERLVIETVKAAEDRSGDVIFRIFEASGSHSVGALVVDGLCDVEANDGLERPISAPWLSVEAPGRARIHARPFQLMTLRAKVARLPNTDEARGD